MSEATEFRDEISQAITDNGSTIIITPRVPTEGSYGGYEPGSDGEGTAVSTKALPSNNLISKEGEPFGKLKAGEVVLVMAYDETILKDYKVTYRNSNYTVDEIKEVVMNDTVLGIRVKLTRQLD